MLTRGELPTLRSSEALSPGAAASCCCQDGRYSRSIRKFTSCFIFIFQREKGPNSGHRTCVRSSVFGPHRALERPSCELGPLSGSYWQVDWGSLWSLSPFWMQLSHVWFFYGLPRGTQEFLPGPGIEPVPQLSAALVTALTCCAPGGCEGKSIWARQGGRRPPWEPSPEQAVVWGRGLFRFQRWVQRQAWVGRALGRRDLGCSSSSCPSWRDAGQGLCLAGPVCSASCFTCTQRRKPAQRCQHQLRRNT